MRTLLFIDIIMESTHQTSLDILIQIRMNFRDLIHSIAEEDLFKIPQGFSNNIIWNFGHAIVSQQGLMYKAAGLELNIDSALIEQFGKGSVPSSDFVEGLKDDLILLSFSTLEQLQKDIMIPGFFDGYGCYKTSFGCELTTIDQAIEFSNMHEGLHLGYAMAQRKAL